MIKYPIMPFEFSSLSGIIQDLLLTVTTVFVENNKNLFDLSLSHAITSSRSDLKICSGDQRTKVGQTSAK